MNWFNEYQLFKIASETITSDGQEGWTDNFGDIQRYGLDPYSCGIYLTKTDKKITVSVTLNSNALGTIMWQKFWKYELSESSKAKETFKEVKKRVSKIFGEFRTNETPNSLLWTHLKDSLFDIDADHIPKTGIPYYNYSQRIRSEKDTRELLYGKRYPAHEGF
jgi:hypothetical protein